METFVFLQLIAIPFVIYFGARIIFLAYFHAKRDFLRRYFKDGNSENAGKQ